MQCRRCKADISNDTEMCPLCGISQKTYITPRNYSNIPHKTKKRSRGTLISMIAMIVAVAGVFVMIFLSNRETENLDYQKVVSAYDAGNEDLLMLAVGQYMKNHPRSDRIDEVQAYLNTLRGIDDSMLDADSDDAAALAESLRQAEIAKLKEIAPDLLTIEGAVLGDLHFDNSRSLTIYWRNMSDKNIKEIQFKTYAYDADGKEIKCERRDRSDITGRAVNEYVPNPEGDVYKNIWLSAWYGSDIDKVKIKSVKIYYDDDSVQTLPSEVVDVIMRNAT